MPCCAATIVLVTYPDASRYVEKLRPTIRNHVNEVRTRCAHQVSQNSQLPVRSLRLLPPCKQSDYPSRPNLNIFPKDGAKRHAGSIKCY